MMMMVMTIMIAIIVKEIDVETFSLVYSFLLVHT